MVSGSADVRVASQGDTVTRGGSYWASDDVLYWTSTTPSTSSNAIRFTNIGIPAGATITAAQMTVYRYDNQWGATSNDYVNIGVEQVVNPGAIADLNDHTSRVTNIGSVVQWPVGKEAQYAPSVSPDLRTIIQAVVDLAPSTSVDSLMFFTRSSPTPDGAYWAMDSYYTSVTVKSTNDYIPRLEISWES